MAVKLYSAQVMGLEGQIIDVEVDLSRGFSNFAIVGLPDKSVEESKERINSAIKNIGREYPQKRNQRVIVSLAPADLKKEGPVFDLAIALAYVMASGQTNFEPAGKIFLGELALDGGLRPIKGALALALAAQNAGFKDIFLPKGNGQEAALIKGVNIYECLSLKEVLEHLEKTKMIAPTPETQIKPQYSDDIFDLSDIKGQETAKRGLEIAAAGGHNVIMTGPPGTGKTMLAKILPSLLPPLSFQEVLEVTKIHSVAGTLDSAYLTLRPFRNPHHTSSYVSLVGGGAWPKPGEVTLAHRGVLFLDEFPEFERRVIESLRQPLEDGFITVARARKSIRFPARVMMVSAMNPCPCGNLGTKNKNCVCSPSAILKYKRKISGPMADRFDLWLEVPQIEHEKLIRKNGAERQSLLIRNRVAKARAIQQKRFEKAGRKILVNSEMNVRDIENLAELAPKSQATLQQAAKNLDLSARAYHKIIKISRTIADLAESEDIEQNHILEALQYRPKPED